MRDKVKRFISILMTALMLVNLLPVGALADGITSIGYKPETVANGNQTVYLYVKVTGNLNGLNLNKSGWCTVGKVTGLDMTDPQSYAWWNGSSNHVPSVSGISASSVGTGSKGNLTRYEKNQSIDLSKVTWSSGTSYGFLPVSTGADDYVGAGWTWHLDGYIDIAQVKASYKIRYVDQDTNKVLQTAASGTDDPGVWIDHTAPKTLEGGYEIVGNTERTFKLVQIDNTFDIYYRRPYGYTVEYYYDDVKDEDATVIGERQMCGTKINTYTPKPKVGYELDETKTTKLPLTIGTDESKNVIKVYYKKIGYTVTYEPGEYGTFKTQKHDAKHGDATPAFDGETTGKPGWTFDGWEPKVADTVTENATYTAVFVPDEKQTATVLCTIDEKQIGYGTVYPSIYQTILQATGKLKGGKPISGSMATANAGYKFVGWYKVTGEETYEWVTGDPDLKQGVAESKLNRDEKTGLYQNTVFVARFEPDAGAKVPVTYEAENGTLEGTTSQEAQVVTGEGLTDVEATPNKGYKFDGWYAVDKNGDKHLISGLDPAEELDAETAKKNLNTDGNLYAATTFIARFVPDTKQSAKVIYTTDGNGTLWGGPAIEKTTQHVQIVTGEVVREDGSVIGDKLTTIPTYPKDGYEFDRWIRVTPEKTIEGAGSALTDEMARPNLNQADDGLYQETEFKAIFKPQTNLSYTVNYYWNGTEIPVKPSKTVLHQTFGEEVTESPIGADDYTPVSTEPKKIKIGADSTQNVINFYYYRNVKLTANSDTKTYNGEDQSVSGYTCAVAEMKDGKLEYVPWTGEKPLIFDGISASGSGKDVNENGYPVTFNKTPIGEHDDLYYVIESQTGTLTISPREVTLTSETASKPYDGNPLTKPDVTVTGDGFVKGEVSDIKAEGTVTHVSEGKVTNTITYTKGANFKESNYTITKKEGELWITPNTDEVVVEIEGRTKTVTYNGEEHTAWQYDVISISDPLYETAPGEVPNFWNKNAKKASGTDAGTYPMGWEAADFENTNTNFSNVTFVVTDGQLVINPRPVVLTSASDKKVYDGEALTNHTVTEMFGTESPFPNGEGLEYDFTGSQTDVGKSANTFTYKAKEGTNTKLTNYAITTEYGTLEVTPVTDRVTVKIKGKTDSVMYDGKPHFVFGFDAEPSNKLYNPNKDMWFNGTDVDMIAEGTDAGTYTMGLEVSDFKNKSDNFTNVRFEVVEDGKLEIKKRSVKLTSASDEKVYDGKPLMNETVAVGGDGFADGEGATYDFTGSQTDVGESDNLFTFEVNEGTKKENYTFEVAIGKLKVNPVTDKVTVTVTEKSDTVTYDGMPHTVSGYTSMTVDNPLYDVENDVQETPNAAWAANGTDAGEYPLGIVAGDFKNTNKNFTNVEFVVVDGKLTITPAPVTLQAPIASKTYDGTPLKAEDYGHSFVEGLDFADDFASISVEGSQTQAGSSVSQIKEVVPKKGKDLKNYKLTFLPGSLTIAKRSVLLTSQSATKTYDGSALTRPAVTITGDGFVPGELAKVEATGSITNVGSTPNAIQYTTTGAFNPANYSIALSVGTLTVTAKPEPEPRRTFNLTVNYVYQNGKRAAASYNRGGLKNGETFDITSPVIAGYTASETVVSGTIDNRDIKVTVIYTADGVNLDDYGVPLGLGNITMNVGDCFE